MAQNTVTLNVAILVQDTSGTVPAVAAQDQKTDQVSGQEEFLSTLVVVPPNTDVATSPVTVDFGALTEAMTLYVEADRPVTMQVGTGTEVLSIRSTFIETYQAGEGPTSLDFGNTDTTNAANVRVIVGGNHT